MLNKPRALPLTPRSDGGDGSTTAKASRIVMRLEDVSGMVIKNNRRGPAQRQASAVEVRATTTSITPSSELYPCIE